MSDKHISLQVSVREVFGARCHSWCLRHLKKSYAKLLSSCRLTGKPKEEGIRLLNCVAYAWEERTYNRALVNLGEYRPQLRQWVEENEPEHWANAKFPMERWGWLTSNPAESLNKWYKDHSLRHKSISGFMKDHMLEVSKFFGVKQYRCSRWKNNCGRRVEKWLKNKGDIAMKFKMTAHPAGESQKYTVGVGYRRYAVDIPGKKCSCGEWQMTGIPCAHVVRASQFPTAPSVYTLISPWYSRERQLQILEYYLPPIEMAEDLNEMMADLSDAERSALPNPLPPVLRRKAGRPKVNRIESQQYMGTEIHCSTCGKAGHNIRTCPIGKAG